MKKILWGSILLLACLFVLSACEGRGQSQAETRTEAESETKAEAATDPQSETEIKTESQTETEAKTESQTETQAETETQQVNVHTHEFSEWITVKEATCTEKGEQERSCSCGEKEINNVDTTAHSYTNGICSVCNNSILDLEKGYTHAIPENQGVQNVIDRAYLLTDVEWTPLKNVPGLQGSGKVIAFEAGVTYKGIPYSGVTYNDCYVGLNVSLESFVTALENPKSVLYTENLQSTNSKAATYFGTVCSKFAQYALDVPGSYNTNNVANIPGMKTLALPGEYTVDQIKLGDVVLNVEKHTTICTDIIYDADGNVAYIEISEATYPVVRRKLWNPEEFYDHFATYRLCRYQYIENTPPAPDMNARDEYALMPRMGDKYNYKQSASKAYVDILEEGYYKAVTMCDGVIVNEKVLNGAKYFTFDCKVPGYIEMYLEKEDGTRSESVYACVVSSTVEVTDSSKIFEGKLSVRFSGSSGTPLYVQVGNAHVIFCSVEGLAETAELSFSYANVATHHVRVAYQNEYGIYLSDWIPFDVTMPSFPNTSTDPLLSQATYWYGFNLTPSSTTPQIQADKVGYWSYTMIPVKENETYYSKGATRMWFLDENGKPISTYNASKDGEIKYQFTTPKGAAYVSIAYSPGGVEPGTESIQVVHNYKDNVCVGCGEPQPEE